MPSFTSGNRRLFYREQGVGPLLAILPGNTASSASHAGELDYFGRWYHTVCLDFIGTGQSERVPAWPEAWWEICAGDVAALVDHLGQGQAILMGTSGGAVVALLAAILYSEK